VRTVEADLDEYLRISFDGEVRSGWCSSMR
jgi:hypothetical protein